MIAVRIELSLEPGTGFAFVPATLEGPNGVFEANLLLDTGAALTTLSSRLSKVLGYELTSLPREEAPVVGGGASSRRMVLNHISIFDSTQSEVPSRFMELPVGFDGLLGNNLLRSFNVIAVLDVRSKKATLVFRH